MSNLNVLPKILLRRGQSLRLVVTARVLAAAAIATLAATSKLAATALALVVVETATLAAILRLVVMALVLVAAAVYVVLGLRIQLRANHSCAARGSSSRLRLSRPRR